jgi:hypothetical protein
LAIDQGIRYPLSVTENAIKFLLFDMGFEDLAIHSATGTTGTQEAEGRAESIGLSRLRGRRRQQQEQETVRKRKGFISS